MEVDQSLLVAGRVLDKDWLFFGVAWFVGSWTLGYSLIILAVSLVFRKKQTNKQTKDNSQQSTLKSICMPDLHLLWMTRKGEREWKQYALLCEDFCDLNVGLYFVQLSKRVLESHLSFVSCAELLSNHLNFYKSYSRSRTEIWKASWIKLSNRFEYDKESAFKKLICWMPIISLRKKIMSGGVHFSFSFVGSKVLRSS